MKSNFTKQNQSIQTLKIYSVIAALSFFPSCVNKETLVVYEPVITEVEVREVSEKLIDLQQQSTICHQPSFEVQRFNPDHAKIRKTVYDKLLEAQALLPANLKLCMHEGYRSSQAQDRLFKHRLNQVRAAYPKLTYANAFVKTSKIVSPVTNLDGTVNALPHTTGGVIDVFLVNDNGKAVDMGLPIKEWGQLYTNLDSARTDAEKISSKARYNRDQMSYALEKVGFVNNPQEYWQWSYGDGYWATFTGNCPIYSSLEETPITLY